jgi:hypothetical protein
LTESIEYREEAIPGHCVTCGAELLTVCSNCNTRIRGAPGGFFGDYQPPQFCDACGAPFPWLGRQGLLYLLENRIVSGDLDPAEELAVREQIAALGQPELDEEEQLRRWSRIAAAVPGFWERTGAREIFVRVATAAIREQLGAWHFDGESLVLLGRWGGDGHGFHATEKPPR